MKITFIIVTSDRLIGELLSFTIAHTNHDVVSLVQDQPSAIRSIQALHPHIVLLDNSSTPILSADDIRYLRSTNPRTRFVLIINKHSALKMPRTSSIVSEGFLHADSSLSELNNCLEKVKNGLTYVSEKVYHQWATNQQNIDVAMAIDLLTKREKEILKLLSEELSTREIAERLFLSETTVNNHKCRMGDKLGLKGHKAIKKLALKAIPWL